MTNVRKGYAESEDQNSNQESTWHSQWTISELDGAIETAGVLQRMDDEW